MRSGPSLTGEGRDPQWVLAVGKRVCFCGAALLCMGAMELPLTLFPHVTPSYLQASPDALPAAALWRSVAAESSTRPETTRDQV